MQNQIASSLLRLFRPLELDIPNLLLNVDIRIIYIFHIFERRLAEMRGGKNRVRNDRALLPGNSFNKSTTVNRPRIRAHVAQSLSVH